MSDSRPSESVLLELFRQKRAEASGMMASAIQVVWLWLAIVGAGLKFALDGSATDELRHVIAVMGLFLCALGALLLWFSEISRKTIQRDLDTLSAELKSPALSGTLKPLMYFHVAGVIFDVVCIAMWVYVLQGPGVKK